MRRGRKRPSWLKRLGISLSILAILSGGWIGYRAVRATVIAPEAILVLGGDPQRENFAATFAREHPDLPIWISSGSNQEYTEGVFSDAGIDFERLHIDRTAEDTVTNFTTLVDELRSRGVSNVYLITSDYHMRRAHVIGEIVFGSRNISLKPVQVPSDQDTEPLIKTVRDGVRAVLWITTGHTGSTLSHHFHQN